MLHIPPQQESQAEWKPKNCVQQGLKARLKNWEDQSSSETWNKNMKKTSNYQIQHPFNIKETEAQDGKWSHSC